MEEWKPIENHIGYEVSSLGRIRSVRFNKCKVLSLSDNGDGYLQVYLGNTGKVWVSREVAKAFVENPEGKPEVDHINRDTKDNRIENLRWATRSENSLNRTHKLPTSGHKFIQENTCGNWKVYIRKMGVNRTFKSLEEAIQFRDGVLGGP